MIPELGTHSMVNVSLLPHRPTCHHPHTEPHDYPGTSSDGGCLTASLRAS